MDGKIPKFTVAIFLIFKMQLCPPDCHVLSPKTFKTYYLCQQGSLNSPAIHNHRRPNANKFVFVLPKWKVCESTTTNQKVHVLPTTTPIPNSYRTHNLRHWCRYNECIIFFFSGMCSNLLLQTPAIMEWHWMERNIFGGMSLFGVDSRIFGKSLTPCLEDSNNIPSNLSGNTKNLDQVILINNW